MCHTEKTEDDGSLILRLRQGELSAFDALFEKYRRGILAYLVGMSGDRGLAEDITQECFIALVRGIDRINPRQGAGAWLYRVARNRMIDLLRRCKHEVLPGDEYFRERQPAPEGAGLGVAPFAGLLSEERKTSLYDALSRLPEKEREVITLRFMSDLSFKEIARAVRRPLGTVLWQVQRGLKRMREVVGSDQ